MKKWYTIAAIALHFTLGGILYAAVTPEDELLKLVSFDNQGAVISLYKASADVGIKGKTYQLTGTTKPDGFGGHYIVEGPTGNAIWLHEDGTATVTINGEEFKFLAE